MYESKITLSQLEAFLWRAADILRGKFEVAEYKEHIFGILLLKRTSDVFDEKRAQLRQSYQHLPAEELEQLIENKSAYGNTFFVPPCARWNDGFSDEAGRPQLALKNARQNIGETLNEAATALEQANEPLREVLTSIDFSRAGYGTRKLDDATLKDLLDYFSNPQFVFSDSHFESADTLGRACDNLLVYFADRAVMHGENFTPLGVSDLVAHLVDPQPGESVYDPAAGHGSTLIKCLQHTSPAGCSLYGQEVNVSTRALAKTNLLLHGILSSRIELGDTLRSPQLVENHQLMKFDVVVADPPFNLSNWGWDTWHDDPYGRGASGLPPRSSGDYAWIQHVVASMKPTSGRAAVMMPHGVLFRGGAESGIRRYLIEHDLLEAVINLGSGLLYGTGLPFVVLIFRSNKPADKQGKVVFIDASSLVEQAPRGHRPHLMQIGQIASWYHNSKNVPGNVIVASIAEIAVQNWNLNIAKYVKPAPGKLLEHAITSIRLGIDDFETKEDDRVFSSIRNLYAGLLLLFKEKLLRLSPADSEGVLIKVDLEPVIQRRKITFRGKGQKTVDFAQIESRFKSLGVQVDWSRVRAIQQKRNSIEHYYTTDRREAIRDVVSNTFVVIRDFIKNELEGNPRELLGSRYWNVLLKTSEVYESQRQISLEALHKIDWTLSKITSPLSEIRCPQCSSPLLEPAESIESDLTLQYFGCMACGQVTAYPAIEEVALRDSRDDLDESFGSNDA